VDGLDGVSRGTGVVSAQTLLEVGEGRARRGAGLDAVEGGAGEVPDEEEVGPRTPDCWGRRWICWG
jgi:hypothetical protein